MLKRLEVRLVKAVWRWQRREARHGARGSLTGGGVRAASAIRHVPETGLVLWRQAGMWVDMVRVRKLGRQVVRNEPLLVRVFAPLRDALREGARLESSLRQSLPGAIAARKLMPGAYFLMLLPALFLAIPVVFLVFITHARLGRQFGPSVTTALEVVLGLALATRSVMSIRAARRPEAEPINEEFTLSSTEVEERLASGRLRPWDLVHDGQVWNTLEQSPAFEFACEAPLARLRTRRRLVGAAKFLAWGAALFAYGRWLFSD